MDGAISAAARVKMAEAAAAMIPMNRDVPFSEEVSQFISPEQVAAAVYPNWATIEAHRAVWTETFDRTAAT